jgi:hypothetical protein
MWKKPVNLGMNKTLANQGFELRESFTQPAIIGSTKEIKAPRPITGAVLFANQIPLPEQRAHT